MDPNVHASNFDEPEIPQREAKLGFGTRWGRLVRGKMLSASLWELPPGLQGCPYHFHRANEELLVVVTGTPTLREPSGTRRLSPGDVVLFGRGPKGAHALINETDEPCRFVFASTLVYPEVAEYPDSKKINVFGRGARGIYRTSSKVGYFDGEDRRTGT